MSPCPPWAAGVGGGHQSHSLPVSRRLAGGHPGGHAWFLPHAALGGAPGSRRCPRQGPSSKTQMVAYTTQKPVVLPFWESSASAALGTVQPSFPIRGCHRDEATRRKRFAHQSAFPCIFLLNPSSSIKSWTPSSPKASVSRCLPRKQNYPSPQAPKGGKLQFSAMGDMGVLLCVPRPLLLWKGLPANLSQLLST